MYLAFLTGFIGSLHCLGMCAPLVLAFPVRNFKTAVLYNIGRIGTYFILGIFFGLFGKVLFVFGFQQFISILAGITMIVLVAIPSFNFKFFQKQNALLKSLFIPFYKKKNNFSIFMIGVLNGLLPCGLVYLGIIGAIAMGDVWQGGFYMAFFGFGTLPMMLMVSISKNLVNPQWRIRFSSYLPVFSMLIGFLFILRGLNLGIPIVSPKMIGKIEQAAECCDVKKEF